MPPLSLFFLFFFFNDTATTEIYTLSLHDALPISQLGRAHQRGAGSGRYSHAPALRCRVRFLAVSRSEEHTSELQSRLHLVCRLLLEKKKKNKRPRPHIYIEHMVILMHLCSHALVV